MKKLKRLSLLLSNKCNLNCTFCFQKGYDGIDNTKEINFKDINMILKKYDLSEGITLNLIGGEPMLFNKCDKLFNFVLSIKEYINNITVFSNLTIKNDSFNNMIKRLSQYFSISYIVTMDSFFENKNRIINLSNHEFHNNMQFISEINNINIEKYILIDRKNKDDFIKNIEYIYNNDIDVYVNFPDYSSSSEYNLTYKDKYFLTRLFLKFVIKNNLFSELYKYSDKFGFVYIKQFEMKKNNIDPIIDKKCRPFEDEIGFTMDGYVIPCSRCLVNKKLFKTIDYYKDKELETIKYNESKCLNCILNNRCHECIFGNFKNNIKNNMVTLNEENCIYKINMYLAEMEAFNEFIEKYKNIWK